MKNKKGKIISLVISIFYICIITGMVFTQQKLQEKITNMQYTIDMIESSQELSNINLASIEIKLSKKWEDIRLTSYYIDNNKNYDLLDDLGIKISDLTINENGWFEYNGRLMISTAVNGYNDETKLKDNYRRFDIGDLITIEIDKSTYKAIVVGNYCASYWDETKQRYGLFVSDKNYKVDMDATIIKSCLGD